VDAHVHVDVHVRFGAFPPPQISVKLPRVAATKKIGICGGEALRWHERRQYFCQDHRVRESQIRHGTAQGEDGGSNRLDKSTITWRISRLNASRYAGCWALCPVTNRNSITL
jgi:hypothetical protein